MTNNISKIKKINPNSGFAILYAMLVIAAITALSLGTISLIVREKNLSSIANYSLNARASADVGLECMLYLDKAGISFRFVDPTVYSGPYTTFCGRDNSGNSVSYTITLTSSSPSKYIYSVLPTTTPTGPCFSGILERTIGAPDTTKIDIQGYNICDPTNLSRVERGILVDY